MSFDLAPSAAPAESRMQMGVVPAGDVLIVTLGGLIDASATGPLCDALVAHVRAGWRRIVIELGAGAEVTRPGLRGFVVAAKLLQARQGQLRICGATAATEAFAERESFRHLLRFDPERAVSLARIAPAVSTGPAAATHFRPEFSA